MPVKSKKRATKAAAKTPCEKKIPLCLCTDSACDHWCCAATRERRNRATLVHMTVARDALVPFSPAYRELSRQMERYGHEPSSDDRDEASDLTSQFNEAAMQSAVQVMGENMRDTRQSQEREHALNRLLASVPRLVTASDLGQVMGFLYRIHCDAPSLDMALALQTAITQCTVPRFSAILRAAPVSMEGWEKACIDVLASVNKHFMQSSKESLMKEMKQYATEDPTQYADRVIAKLDVYVYFAGITRKVVDDQETARAWVAGLDPTTRVSVSVALNAVGSYTIQDALEVARIAYMASAPAVGLQSLEHGPCVPQAPIYDSGFLQQMIDSAVSQATAGHAASNAAIEARIAALQPPAVGSMLAAMAPEALGLPTKFPCAYPGCRGALHRFEDCQYKRQCIHCPKWGHHSAGCYTEFPELSHFPKPVQSPYKYQRGQDRSPRAMSPRAGSHNRDRARSKGRDRDRDRDREGRTSSSSGKRLNEKGRS
jgi:hypothetical protein